MNLISARSISLDSTFKDDFAGQVEVGGKVLKMTEEVVDSAGIADCTSSSPCETLPCRYCTKFINFYSNYPEADSRCLECKSDLDHL
jgi:hypothetical protein